MRTADPASITPGGALRVGPRTATAVPGRPGRRRERPTLPARSRALTLKTYSPAGAGRPRTLPSQRPVRRPSAANRATARGRPASVAQDRQLGLGGAQAAEADADRRGVAPGEHQPGRAETIASWAGLVSTRTRRPEVTERPWPSRSSLSR